MVADPDPRNHGNFARAEIVRLSFSKKALPVHATHRTGLEQLLMHRKRARQGLRSLSVFDLIEVTVQLIAIVGMSAVIHDDSRALVRGLAAQIGDTILGYYCRNRVFAMIKMTYKWNNRADLSALCCRWAGED